MKKKFKPLIAAFYLLGLVLKLHAQGYIVTDGVLYGGYETGMVYSIFVMDNPSGHPSGFSQYTKFWLNPVGKTQPTVYTNTFSLAEMADIGVRLFLVASNDPISLQPIIAQSYPEMSIYSPDNYVFKSGIPFYVALYTGYQFTLPYSPNPPYTYLDPVFGWAKMVNNQGVIQLLDSALEYGGLGIIAGTRTIIQPVPEPSSCALAVASALLAGLWRWRK